MKTKFALLFLSTFLLFLSCERSVLRPSLIWVEKEIGGCNCNPWGDSFGLTEEDKGTTFFEDNGIEVFGTKIERQSLPALCALCCGCPSGEFLHIQIRLNQLEEAEFLGFLEE